MPKTALDIDEMQASAGRACDLMKVLANPDRLLILCQLSQREMCVTELEHDLGIVQPTLSQQLSVLRKAALVATRRDGKNIFYELQSGPALAVIKTLYEHFCKDSPRVKKR
jgi:DNA-binding transcriptional ArsR family regulator